MGAHANGFRRPAAFVYDVPGGFAWVEPAYLDPYGASSHALHIIHGTIEPDPDAEAPGTQYRFESEDYSGTIEQDVCTNGGECGSRMAPDRIVPAGSLICRRAGPGVADDRA